VNRIAAGSASAARASVGASGGVHSSVQVDAAVSTCSGAQQIHQSEERRTSHPLGALRPQQPVICAPPCRKAW